MGKYILALDQGTTSSRAILFDEAERMVSVAQQEFSQIYPQEGWVEQNPMEIYSSQYAVMMEVIARTGVNVGEIAAIGITNQRETTILWIRPQASQFITPLCGSAGGRRRSWKTLWLQG